ncbi:TPM domain-containing protein [Herbiconiux sp. YIM B11900]|uniref:TPM domain-containing protein n=1 Tax=Herbiconiux sp. YIM B11900 TaxID=3404131 RepID=UPI003F86BF49
MRHPHRTRRAAPLRTLVATAVAAIGLALLAPAAPAFAGDPVDLNGRYIVDEAGVLGSQQSEVQDAIDTLATEHGVNLFVVYTDAFTNPSDRQQWATDVANQNQFGTNDVLLAVAVDDRVYQLSVDADFPLSDAQLSSVENDDIVPQLRDSDWAGAAVAAAEGLGDELGGGSSSSEASGSGFAVSSWLIAIVIILLVLGGLIFFLVRRRKKLDARATEQAAVAGPTQKELDQQVGAVLVDLDDAVTSSDEELGFAVAQFGTEATKGFSDTLATVKASLSQAFTLKQKLDDAVPDTAEERRSWSEQIIAICDQASDALDEQLAAFTALRDVERDPAPALETARGELAAIATGGADARERLLRLSQAYDAPALTTVSGSAEQIDRLRVFAEAQIAEAAAAVTAGDTASAALKIRTARQAIAQAQTLTTAVAGLETDLTAAGTALAAAIADAEQDLADVARLQATASATPGTVSDPALTSLSSAVGVELQRARSTGARDPLNARLALEKADVPLDQALAAVRGEQERIARVTAQRDRAIAGAQSEVAQAAAYLQTRRGAVGPDARTRLSEAQRHLDQAVAIAIADPEGSLREATTASQLASRASASAQQDVSWAQSSEGGYGGGSSYGNSGGGSDFNGALLGGLLGNLLGGGGGGGGYSGGGSSWGGGWGGGSRGGGSRSSGSSSRRSSGGSRSSGGGRRGGGGRF